MANKTNIYPLGLERIIEEGLDSMTLKLDLLGTNTATYVYDSTHEYWDEGTDDTGDPSYCICTATDYVTKSISPTIQHDALNDRIEVVISDQTWTALGVAEGAGNDTIVGAVLWDDSGTPTTSPLIAFWLLTSTLTTNQDFVLDFDANEGNIRIPYTIAS